MPEPISRSDFRSRPRGRRPAEIAALAEILPPGTPVYFSAVPTIEPPEIVAAAASVRKAGLEPVIHIAARRIRRPPTCRICCNACAAKPMSGDYW